MTADKNVETKVILSTDFIEEQAQRLESQAMQLRASSESILKLQNGERNLGGIVTGIDKVEKALAYVDKRANSKKNEGDKPVKMNREQKKALTLLKRGEKAKELAEQNRKVLEAAGFNPDELLKQVEGTKSE